MRNAATRFGALVAAALTLSLAACDGTSSRRAGDVGAVKMALDIAPGTTLNTVSYVINGPGAFMKTGTLDVSHSSTISADFSPLPPGMGYTIGLSATSMDGGTMCMGSQTFDVAARMTTSVLVHLLCRQPTTNGSVTFNGALNVCPLIDSIGSSPSEVFVGGSIMLSALGHDTDSGPSPLTYQWTATPPAAGTLNNATLQNATFACAAPGSVSITLTLSDGDGACIDTQTMSVTCTASPSGSGGSVGSAGTSGSAGSSTGAAGATGGAGGGAAGASGGAGGGAAGATGGVGGGAAGASGGAGGGAAGASGGAGGGAAGATGGAGGGAAGASGGAGGGAAGATGGAGGGAAGASGGAGGGAAGASGGAGGGAAGASGGAGGGAAGATGGVGGGAAGATGGAGGSVSCGPGSSNAAVVVYRVGDGSGSLLNTGNVVVLDAFTAAGGSPVCSTALPTTPSGTNHSLIASGTATSEGLLSRSTDGHSIVLAGYGGMLGVSSLSGTTSAATPRVVARVDAAGAIDTTTALTDWASGNNPRSVASTDGTSLWLGGAAGSVRFASLGATTSTQLNTVLLNIRQVSIFGGQLYSSSSSSTFRLATVGTGLPTTAGQTITNLPAWPTTGSPYGFFFADLDGVAGIDTVYVADDGSSGTFGGLDKYSLVGGSWAANGILGTAADAYRGLTGTQNGSTVTLYATRKGGAGATGGGELVSIVDASGFNAMITATPTVLATAANNTAYRGVALAPQ